MRRHPPDPRERLADDPYPLADVDDWPDDDPDPDQLDLHVAATAARVRRASALAVELGDAAGDPTAEISDDPLLATYHLSALAPIGPADSHRLLCAPGPAARLDVLDEILDDVEAGLRFRLLGQDDELDDHQGDQNDHDDQGER